MLNTNKIFSGFSVDNFDKAREFYVSTLGLKVKNNPKGFLELHLEGNNPIIIYLKPAHEAASFTILNFPVEDIDETVDALREKGVVFLQYSGQIKTDEKGICRGDVKNGDPHVAWFKDPAGNILSVLEGLSLD